MELSTTINATELFTAASYGTTVNPRYYSYLPVPLPGFALYAFISLCFLGFVIGSIGNVLVIVAIAQTRKLRTTANAFLASLAVADVATCVIVLPILATALISLETIITSHVLCRLFYHTTLTFSPVSIQHLILIAANRYTLINKNPRIYVKIFNKRTISVFIACIWVINVLLNFGVAVTSYGARRFFGKDYCFLEQKNAIGTLYWLITLLYTFLSCFVIIPLFYILTFRTVHKSHVRVKQDHSMTDAPSIATVSVHPSTLQTAGGQRQPRRLLSSSEIKLTKVNFFIFITNVFFLSPLFFVLAINGGEITHGVFVLILFPIGMNSVTNPLVYCGFNRNFRQAFKAILKL